MGVDYSTLIYGRVYEMFARSVTVTPIASQPGQSAYVNRGVFNTRPLDIIVEGNDVVSDTETILDVRDAEYTTVPQQGDQIDIPADVGAMGALGLFEVLDTDPNGGGETTLTLRKIRDPLP